VLIYYAGHGDQAQWNNSSVWHEMLVPNDPELNDIQPAFDVEVNALVNAIAQRTSDVTVVLDCCNSAGATRDLEELPAQGDVRALGGPARTFAPPDLPSLGVTGSAARDIGTRGLLQAETPSYLVAVACQADETAKEGAAGDGVRHGVFSQSLIALLEGLDAGQRARLRWGDIWTNMLVKASDLNKLFNQKPQHPWIIGESARRIFGGTWEPMDLGLPVRRTEDGNYQVEAGTITGVTDNAEIAIYEAEPRRFAPIGDPADRPIGRLRVVRAERSQCVAAAIGPAFELPLGARARLVKPGAGERLRVSVKPEGTAVPDAVTQSPLLALIGANEPGADVELIRRPDGHWVIGNEVEPLLALIPPGGEVALRPALEHCYRYQTVLRLARNSNSPELANSLVLRLLDCNDEMALEAMTPEELSDPQLSEAPRDADRIYALQEGYRFCVHISNQSRHRLQVALFDCTSGGVADLLSDAVLRPGASHVMWLDGRIGVPMGAYADAMPLLDPAAPPPFVTDRLIAVGTSRPDADLRHLMVEGTVQKVVEDNLPQKGMRGDEDRGGRPPAANNAPAELWTATIVPVRILRD
jgi:hypothetical protein